MTEQEAEMIADKLVKAWKKEVEAEAKKARPLTKAEIQANLAGIFIIVIMIFIWFIWFTCFVFFT